MRRPSWLFPPRRQASAPIDGANVLDRVENRLGTRLKGDVRIILAGQLEVAIQRIRSTQSLATAALNAQREGARIAAMLPRPFGTAIAAILADELIRGHRGGESLHH